MALGPQSALSPGVFAQTKAQPKAQPSQDCLTPYRVIRFARHVRRKSCRVAKTRVAKVPVRPALLASARHKQLCAEEPL